MRPRGTGRAAAMVDEARLWRRHMEMAKLGATPKGGVRRPALTADDNRARALLAEWGAALGFTSAIDPIGNFFVRREGSLAGAAPEKASLEVWDAFSRNQFAMSYSPPATVGMYQSSGAEISTPLTSVRTRMRRRPGFLAGLSRAVTRY